MSRRKKDPPKAVSSTWKSYKPTEDLYWRLGGPFVPPEEIPPQEYSYGMFGSTMSKNARLKWMTELIEKAEEDQVATIALYLKLRDEGIDGLPYSWQIKEDRDLMAAPHRWGMVARNVDRAMSSCVRTIAMNKNKLASYRAQVEALETESLPLFFGRS